MNECMRFQCLNGGVCRNLDGSYECDCPVGWEGDICERGRSDIMILAVLRENLSSGFPTSQTQTRLCSLWRLLES